MEHMTTYYPAVLSYTDRKWHLPDPEGDPDTCWSQCGRWLLSYPGATGIMTATGPVLWANWILRADRCKVCYGELR